MPAPAAWLPDPLRRYDRRYWDGERWTQQVSTGDGGTYTDPIPLPRAAEPTGKKMVRCGNCGIESHRTATVCIQCHTSLAELAPPPDVLAIRQGQRSESRRLFILLSILGALTALVAYVVIAAPATERERDWAGEARAEAGLLAASMGQLASVLSGQDTPAIQRAAGEVAADSKKMGMALRRLDPPSSAKDEVDEATIALVDLQVAAETLSTCRDELHCGIVVNLMMPRIERVTTAMDDLTDAASATTRDR